MKKINIKITKISFIIYSVLIIIIVKLICNYIVNAFLINKYNKHEYLEECAKILQIANVIEPYIANYNMGNILYQNGEYVEAIEEYEKALKGMPSKNKECNIRINYALAICKTVQVDESDGESIRNAIRIYEEAVEVLTEKGCADKDNDNGHSKKAEQLKKDIQKEIERLKRLENSSSESKKEKEEEKEVNEKEKQKETIESKIQGIKENALQNQREVESRYKNYDYNRVEKNW